jgi:hypothetical protein
MSVKNSTPNISTRCKRNSYITSIPIYFVLPKLLNYLAFQSFDFELPWWVLFQKRYWECCFYDVGFGAVGDVVLWFYGGYGLTLLGMLDFCFVSAVLCPSLLICVTSVLSVPKDFIYNSFFHHILLKILTKI